MASTDFSHIPDHSSPEKKSQDGEASPMQQPLPYTDPSFYIHPQKAVSGPGSVETPALSEVPSVPITPLLQPEQNIGDSSRKKVAGIGGIISLLVALFLKVQTFLLIFIKAGPVLLSALLSIGVYTLLFGWQFAIGFVALLFLHEMGHAAMMKYKGIPLGGLIFIPLIGAAVTMQQRPHDVAEEAAVGIAGPIAGTIASLLCLFVGISLPASMRFWDALAYTGLFMNLFNMIPVLPFDGGRVLAAIDRRLWYVGFAILLVLEILSWISGNPSPFLLLFLILAGFQLWTHRHSGTGNELYYHIRLRQRVFYATLYFGLLLLIVAGMFITQSLLPA
jgi:Zn-dependent protease